MDTCHKQQHHSCRCQPCRVKGSLPPAEGTYKLVANGQHKLKHIHHMPFEKCCRHTHRLEDGCVPRRSCCFDRTGLCLQEKKGPLHHSDQARAPEASPHCSCTPHNCLLTELCSFDYCLQSCALLAAAIPKVLQHCMALASRAHNLTLRPGAMNHCSAITGASKGAEAVGAEASAKQHLVQAHPLLQDVQGS